MGLGSFKLVRGVQDFASTWSSAVMIMFDDWGPFPQVPGQTQMGVGCMIGNLYR
jgi:hypothetical protein